MQETGENLIEKPLCPGRRCSTERSWTFEQVTDEQTETYQLKTGKLRMDSMQMVSPGQDLRQSPDDWEATYRRKGDEGHHGYVANLTETCNPMNDFQLINKVQVEPNNVEDADMLEEALPDLKERTKVKQIYTDGGYESPDVDEAMREANVEQIQTAIRRRKPAEEKLGIDLRLRLGDRR